MIVLVASTDLAQQDAVDAARQAIAELGGAVSSVESEHPGALRIDASVPGIGISALGGYLASGGIQLAPTAETVLAGTSAGVLVSTMAVTLVVMLQPPEDA